MAASASFSAAAISSGDNAVTSTGSYCLLGADMSLSQGLCWKVIGLHAVRRPTLPYPPGNPGSGPVRNRPPPPWGPRWPADGKATDRAGHRRRGSEGSAPGLAPGNVASARLAEDRRAGLARQVSGGHGKSE